MSNATMTAYAVESAPTTTLAAGVEPDSPHTAVEVDAEPAATAPAACAAGECVCSAEPGHVFGGLPYVLTLSMSVAGLGGIDVAEARGHVGKIMAGPGVMLEGGAALPGVRSLEVAGPTVAEIYRATADKLEGMVPELRRVADEAEAEAAAAAAEGDDDPADEAEGEVPVAAEAGCGGQATAAAGCPGPSGPLADPEPAGDGEAATNAACC